MSHVYIGVADGLIRHYVSEVETLSVLEACHSSPVGGHHSGIQTAIKFCNVAIIGQPSTKMIMSSSGNVICAKEMEVFLDGKS